MKRIPHTLRDFLRKHYYGKETTPTIEFAKNDRQGELNCPSRAQQTTAPTANSTSPRLECIEDVPDQDSAKNQTKWEFV